MSHRITICGAVAADCLALVAPAANSQTVIEQAAEHRFQLDFHVNDAVLAKMLPAGWETMIATQGPAKDCNLRMIFIDRMAIIGSDGKPAVRRIGSSNHLPCPTLLDPSTDVRSSAMFRCPLLAPFRLA